MVYKIGNLVLKNRFLLAPMLESNDIAFRLLCKKSGCGLTYTGMVSPMSRQKMNLDDRPAVQLFGNSSRGILNFIKKYDSKVSLWDFNLGCPSKLSRELGHGAFMHNNLKSIKNILNIMRNATDKPISIKLRKSDNAIGIAKMAEEIGVNAIGIHARTFEQGYSGDVDYDFALRLKKSLKIPVIFSGNVNKKNIKNILKDFDFVFVGRIAIGNPEIFSELNRKNCNINFIDYLKLAKKYKLFFRQIKFQAMNFTKGMHGAKELRMNLVDAKSIFDIEKLMKTYK